MFYSVDGKIVQVGDAFPERKVNTLTFNVDGTQFPQQGPFYFFGVNTENSGFTINYGDGFSEVFELKVLGGDSRAFFMTTDTVNNFYEIPRHIYQDGKSGVRAITFEFEKPQNLTSIESRNHLFQNFPLEISEFKNFRGLRLIGSSFLDLQNLNLNNNFESFEAIQAAQNKLLAFPNSFFNTKLNKIFVDSLFDFDTPNFESTNFFKINQLKDTLTQLRINNNNIRRLPESIRDCVLLENVQIQGNLYEEFPKQLESLININNLLVGSNLIRDFKMINFINNNKIVQLSLIFNKIDLSDLSLKWKGLKSLKTIAFLYGFILNDIMFDEFIDQFYNLCITNAYLEPQNAPLEEEYPNQFRDVNYGDSRLTQTGAIQAPAGFVQGVDNGNPANQGQKIYVLVNNYGHNVTTSGNFN